MLFSAEQGLDDVCPFCVERRSVRRPRAAGTRIPIAGVCRIALLAMKVGVNPGTFATSILLGTSVRPVPVAARVVPERLKRMTDTGRRLRVARDRLLKIRK